MVDEAAKEAGYSVKGLHATNADFTVFDIGKSSDINYHGKGIYFTNSHYILLIFYFYYSKKNKESQNWDYLIKNSVMCVEKKLDF